MPGCRFPPDVGGLLGWSYQAHFVCHSVTRIRKQTVTIDPHCEHLTLASFTAPRPHVGACSSRQRSSAYAVPKDLLGSAFKPPITSRPRTTTCFLREQFDRTRRLKVPSWAGSTL